MQICSMTGHVYIYGGIGTDVRAGEISAENVRQQMLKPENRNATDLILHIASGGGDVMQGEEIYNILKNSGKKIITHAEGTIASIATLIAAAGERILMNEMTRFMIHNPKISIPQISDANELRHAANQLDQVKNLLIGVYDKKTSLGKEKLWELYDNETWLTAEQAKQMGFIDEALPAIKAVAKIDLKNFKQMENKKKANWLIQKIENLLKGADIVNEFTETLADGRKIVVQSDDEDWTGKKVTLEDGTALEPGDHPLASGKTISVDDQGTITKIGDPVAVDDKTKTPDKVKELETLLEAARKEQQTAVTEKETALQEATQAKAEKAKIENRVKLIEKDFLALKEQMSQTLGNQDPPPAGSGAIKNAKTEDERTIYDPMGEEFKKSLKARNLI